MAEARDPDNRGAGTLDASRLLVEGLVMDTRVRRQLRKLSRARWVAKYWTVQGGLGDASLVRKFMFILMEPTDTHSYPLANAPEMADGLAEVLQCSSEQVKAYFAEIESDRELLDAIAAQARGRPDAKRYRALGRYFLSYAVCRINRPQLVVEVGTHQGRGAAVLSKALDLNESEGDPGRLVSIDINPDSGFLVPPPHTNTRLVIGSSPGAVREVLEGERVDFLLSDSTNESDMLIGEFSAALDAARFPLVIMQNGRNDILRQFAQDRDADFARIAERAKDHVVWGRNVDVARFDHS